MIFIHEDINMMHILYIYIYIKYVRKGCHFFKFCTFIEHETRLTSLNKYLLECLYKDQLVER